MSHIKNRFAWIGWIQVVLLAFALALPGLAEAKDKRELVVMTQNLYLGSSLEPALRATNVSEFLEAVAIIHGTVQFTDFATRAEAIADTIAARNPDLIGLQEVSNWIAEGGVACGGQNFLEILLPALESRGLSYSVVAISGNANIGPIPLYGPDGFTGCWLTLQDRDVILVNNRTPGLRLHSTQSGNYLNQEIVVINDIGPLSFNRGWTLVDGSFQGKKFRFVNTHLEEESYPLTQEAQAMEFLAGPARAPGAVIAVGDFNSAADGSNTQSYALLTHAYFKDSWNANAGDPGYTCCQDGTLTNTDSLLYERIDLILTHGASRSLNAEMVNDQPFINGYTPPFWPSDHAGVVSTVRIH